MTEERPDPPTSWRMNPLAWIILAALVVLAIVALVQCRGTHTAPRSGVNVPESQPAAEPVMPNQPTISDRQAGPSNALGDEARQANPSSNEPGGNMTTGGGANTTGSAAKPPT